MYERAVRLVAETIAEAGERHGPLTTVAPARQRHRVGVLVAFLYALVLVATQGAGPVLRRPGLLAEACRRCGLALGRQLGQWAA